MSYLKRRKLSSLAFDFLLFPIKRDDDLSVDEDPEIFTPYGEDLRIISM